MISSPSSDEGSSLDGPGMFTTTMAKGKGPGVTGQLYMWCITACGQLALDICFRMSHVPADEAKKAVVQKTSN